MSSVLLLLDWEQKNRSNFFGENGRQSNTFVCFTVDEICQFMSERRLYLHK